MKLNVIEDGVQSELDLDLAVISIGRAKDNVVRLISTRVSRHHARIESRGGAPWILDLGSANGIEVNGEFVDRCMLRSGDEISLGLGVRIVLGDDVPGGEQFETEEEVGLRTLTGEAHRERENLRVFARITRELAAHTELQPLLDLIVDSAVALVGGERGFMLLREDNKAGASAPDAARSMSVSVARSFDHTNVAVPRTRLSMGIADQVVQEGKPVLSVDASQDERFAGMASVENLRLRSVICLPILTEGAGSEEVEGILYVDNRLQSGAFDREDLDLLKMLAAQASIAIRNARLLETLRSRNHHLDLSRQQIEGLNEQLGRKVRDREGELAVVRAELGRARGRYDYKNIVGASDAMTAIFKQVDHIIESDLPVLIQGESGTGKELIAHAIHYNGPRQNKAFVTENCAALPETLLLFVGYSRSGHSLVGSLIDAHPNAIISHELHAAKHLAAGASLVRVQRAIALNAFFFHYFGRGYSGYDYAVPGQMQGRFRRLQVLGDKKANGTTRLLRSDPDFARRLRESVGVPVRWMHVIRNPFDNITTKARRTRTSLGFAADVYFRHVEAVEALRRAEGDRVIDVYLDELTEDPRAVMGSLVETLGLTDTPADYLDACAERVFAKPRRTSSASDWTGDLLRDVRARLRDCEFLARFADEPIAT